MIICPVAIHTLLYWCRDIQLAICIAVGILNKNWKPSIIRPVGCIAALMWFSVANRATLLIMPLFLLGPEGGRINKVSL